jgi:hypothetical protein
MWTSVINFFIFYALLLLAGCLPNKSTPTLPPKEISSITHDAKKQIIPLGGNAWASKPDSITDEGLFRWSSPTSVCKTYLRIVALYTRLAILCIASIILSKAGG